MTTCEWFSEEEIAKERQRAALQVIEEGRIRAEYQEEKAYRRNEQKRYGS